MCPSFEVITVKLSIHECLILINGRHKSEPKYVLVFAYEPIRRKQKPPQNLITLYIFTLFYVRALAERIKNTLIHI